MNIAKYVDDFHDGSIISIEHIDNKITIFMESAEIDPTEIHEDIKFTKRDTIKGRLHVEGSKTIIINGQPFHKKLQQAYDKGKIFEFRINQELNKITLMIDWKNLPPKKRVNEFSVIDIEAEKIWWENIPNLYDPLERYVDISKHTAYFHDGSISAIEQSGNAILISLESAEVDPEDIQEIPLTKGNQIRGKLHIERFKQLLINGVSVNEVVMTHDDGEIFDLEISENKIFLLIEWNDFLPKSRISEIATIEIEAEKIWWENIPDSGESESPIELPTID